MQQNDALAISNVVGYLAYNILGGDPCAAANLYNQCHNKLHFSLFSVNLSCPIMSYRVYQIYLCLSLSRGDNFF
ncbi:MAG: hypothetical protein NVS2B12_39000 [Ktedonobacteraceae bacterium]